MHYMVRTKPYENKFRQQQTNKNGEIQIDIPEKDKIEQYIYVVLEDKQLKHKHTFYVPDAFDYHVDFWRCGYAVLRSMYTFPSKSAAGAMSCLKKAI